VTSVNNISALHLDNLDSLRKRHVYQSNSLVGYMFMYIHVAAGSHRLPWLRFFRAFSSIVRQMLGYNSQRRGTARTLPKHFVLFHVLSVLCRSVYCLCVNVYCTTATVWQPNCSLTNISCHIILKQEKYYPTKQRGEEQVCVALWEFLIQFWFL